MTNTAPPILTMWDGEALVPASQIWARRADQHFVVGEEYRVEVREERSIVSHNHYFAALTEGFKNLREEHAERFPTPDHLRKWLLIQAGYRDERSIVCASKAEARRVAAFIKPLDDYAVVVVQDAVVIHLTAKSQSMKAMGKKVFQQSKDDVLNGLAKMIDVPSEDLRRNAGKAA